jgi:tetratricopeptide (TPR) repeat protein
MSEVAPQIVSNVAEGAQRAAEKCSVRAAANTYVAALFFLGFLVGFVNFLGFPVTALILLVAVWIFLPLLFWFDRVEFDGKVLVRRGAAAFIYKLLNAPARLKIADIEQIETHSVWTVQSGGRVYYRYNTVVAGGDTGFVIASGGKNYRQMVRRLFAVVPEEKLDARSIELRDFLAEPNALEQKIADLKLPSSEVLDETLPRLRRARKRREAATKIVLPAEESEATNKFLELRQAANELRVAGNLSQSLEAFRRALLIQPENGWLIYEFARALHAYAAAARNTDWLRRAAAALRLAARKSARDAQLLARIGESYLQIGSSAESSKMFRRSLELETENFRAECGLAEIGLQDGKIAHVVHHFQSAVAAAKDAATERWAQAEAEYFSLLNADADYLETEIARINWLNNANYGRRICLRLTLVGLPMALVGTFLSQQLTALGWAISAVAVAGWAILSVVERILDARFPPSEEE